MTEEPVKFEFLRYIDDEGNPTCALDRLTGRVCQFLGTKSFGTRDVCMFPGIDRGGYGDNLFRNDEVGYLIPHPECPMWKKNAEVETRCSLCGSPFRVEKCSKCGREYCPDHLYCNPSSNGTWTSPKCGGCIGLDEAEKKKD